MWAIPEGSEAESGGGVTGLDKSFAFSKHFGKPRWEKRKNGLGEGSENGLGSVERRENGLFGNKVSRSSIKLNRNFMGFSGFY